MKFSSALEMYNTIMNKGDLYNLEMELYVFQYNDLGSICSYHIVKELAVWLQEKTSNCKLNNWSSCLGAGGIVHDSLEYNMENKLDLMDYALEWCEDMYKFDGWIFAKDY